MPLTTFYRKQYGYRLGDFPATDAVAARALALPLYEAINAQRQRAVVEVVLKLLG
jgi:dTDP-4-amino-4,6-dideoxygalactose transaminase